MRQRKMASSRRVRRSRAEGSRWLVDETEADGFGGSILEEPEFRNAYLILPRENAQIDHEYTFSAAASARSPRERPLYLKQPRELPSVILTKHGLIDVEKAQPNGLPQASTLSKFGKGIFTRQPGLGMAAAYFRDENVETEARKELEDEFELIPNFPVTMPCRVRVPEVAATRGMAALQAHWPEESGVAAAHRDGVRGAGVLVGVLDTGIDADHDEFQHMSSIPFRYVPLFPKDVPPRDIRGFDTQGHGTHVCGILAGKNVGVAPETSLSVAAVIESESTRTSLIRVTYGLEWIMQQFSRLHVDQSPAVLSMSLGFPPVLPGLPQQEFERWINVIRRIMNTLISANVLPVVAIGNEGADRYRFPGVLREVVGVGACDFQRSLADFSGSFAGDGNLPRKPDVVGYGVSVYSSLERNYNGKSVYQRFNGTSMATPYVAGIAALYRCRQPTASVDEVRQMLLDSAIPLPDDDTGAGLARYRS